MWHHPPFRQWRRSLTHTTRFRLLLRHFLSGVAEPNVNRKVVAEQTWPAGDESEQDLAIRLAYFRDRNHD